MSFDPKNVVNAARDIATDALDKASEIVENAGDIVRGDVAGGTSRIVDNSLEIASNAVSRVKEVLTPKGDETEHHEDAHDA